MIAFDPKYPAPDRSRRRILYSRDEDGVIDIGWCEGLLADGRPFRVEMWAQDGLSMLTIFFSTIGLEGASQKDLGDLIVAESLVSFRPDVPERCDPHLFTDDTGCAFWSVNVFVGDEDRSFLQGSIRIVAYSRTGDRNSLFAARAVPTP